MCSFSLSTSPIFIHELEPCLNSRTLSLSNFLWSKYLSIVNERSVSDEFYYHYLASINSGFEAGMKLEYCYDIQQDLYWLTQIQLVSHSLILLHYVGIPEEDTSNDFWAYVYEQRCHPIGWCKVNSKLMLPPAIVTKGVIQQTGNATNTIINGNDKQTLNNEEGNEQFETPASYLFDQVNFNVLNFIVLNQLKMINYEYLHHSFNEQMIRKFQNSLRVRKRRLLFCEYEIKYFFIHFHSIIVKKISFQRSKVTLEREK